MTKFSGRTGQAFAQLLVDQATHATIEALYLRFDVPPLGSASNLGANKMSKATNLVRTLIERGDDSMLELIEYAASPSAKLNTTFRRGSAESLDLYKSLDKDLSGSQSSSPKTDSNPSKRVFARPGTTAPVMEYATRQFARPGTTGPIATPAHEHAAATKRYVFVVRGRDQAAYNALAELLVSLDLRIITWEEATRGVESGTPHTLDIVRAGIDMSNAVVVLMTPDDLGQVKPEFGQATDNPREGTPSGQARQNVVFEAGWAMALNQGRVVLVRVGDVRNLSDIEGLNYVNLTNDISARKTFINRLKNCELAVDDSGEPWRTAGKFPDHN